jgi:hypothetical protein
MRFGAMVSARTRALDESNQDIQVGRFKIIPDRGGHEVSPDAERKIETSVKWGPRKGTYSNGRGERASAIKTQRSIRFRMVNETPRTDLEQERSA